MNKIISLSMAIFINLCLFNQICFSDTKAGNKWQLDTAITGFTQYQVAYVKNKYHVSVGQKGTIRISKDGLNWTTVPSGTTNDLYGITYNNKIFIAVGQNGTILTSANGATWKKVDISCKSTFYKIQYIKGIFFAASSTGDMWTSKNGTVWSKINLNISGQSFLVDTIWTGKEYAILLNSSMSFPADDNTNAITIADPSINAYGKTSFICFSFNGTAWNVHEFPNTLTSICSNGKSIVLAGIDTIFTLNSKNAWVKTDVCAFFQTFQPIRLNTMVWNGRKFTILGASGSYLLSMNSTDGIHWSYYKENLSLGDGFVQTRKLYWTGKLFIGIYYICTPPGYTVMGLHYSANGIYWRNAIIHTSAQIAKLIPFVSYETGPYNLCFDGNNYVAIGIHGWSAISKDGISWTDNNINNFGSLHFSTLDGIKKVFWSEEYKSFYVVTDMFKDTYSSVDGIKWSIKGAATPYATSIVRFSPPIQTDTSNQVILNFPDQVEGINLTDYFNQPNTLTAIKSNGNYVAIYDGKFIIASKDGINWVKKYECKRNVYINSLKLFGSQYIAVGSKGLIITSDNGSTWKDEGSPIDDEFTDVAYGDNKFLIISINGNIVYKQFSE